MYEDDPQDRVFDVLGEAVFGDHPLGRPVIGRADVIASTSAAGLHDFHAAPLRARATSSSRPPARWTTTRSSSSRAGARRAARARARRSRRRCPSSCRRTCASCARRPSSTTSRSARPALARDDERRFILRVLDNILGGTSSSRLFQEVRELRGLAYNVYSFQSLHAGTGLIGVYLGTRPDNVAPALQVVADELERLREDGVTAEELERSKENVKGRIVLSLESTAARMSRLGSAVLSELPLLSLDEVVERIESVTLDEVNGLLRELLAPERLSAAGDRRRRGRLSQRDRAARARAARREVDRGMIRVAVAGAAGRMGQAVVAAVEGADDMQLTGQGRPGARHDARRRARRRRRRRRLHAARHRARQRAGSASRPACTSSSGRRASTSSRCASSARRARQRLHRAELRDQRRAHDALRRRGLQAHGQGRDRRAAPRRQARRAVGHRRAHGAAHGGRRADPLGPAARARRPPGGHLRRRRPVADDPPGLLRRASRSCPACCSPCARVGELDESPVVGLEHLLF